MLGCAWLCCEMRGRAWSRMVMAGVAKLCLVAPGRAQLCLAVPGRACFFVGLRLEIHDDAWLYLATPDSAGLRMAVSICHWPCASVPGFARLCPEEGTDGAK